MLLFGDIPLGLHITAGSLGGNLHNSYLEYDTQVSIFKAVEIHNQKLCHTGNYVSFKTEDDEVIITLCIIIHQYCDKYYKVKIGKLASCVKENSTGESFCVVNLMEYFLLGGTPITNEMDCPLVENTHRFEVVSSVCIIRSISILHACGSSCTFVHNQKTTIEREEVTVKNFRTIKHDQNNNMYFINIYCMA